MFGALVTGIEAVSQRVRTPSLNVGQLVGLTNMQLAWNRFEPELFDRLGDEYIRLQWVKVAGRLVWLERRRHPPCYDVRDHSRGYLPPYRELRHLEACDFVYDVGSRASFDNVKRY